MQRAVQGGVRGRTVGCPEGEPAHGVRAERSGGDERDAVNSEQPRRPTGRATFAERPSEADGRGDDHEARQDEVEHLDPAAGAVGEQAPLVPAQVEAVADERLRKADRDVERPGDHSVAEQGAGDASLGRALLRGADLRCDRLGHRNSSGAGPPGAARSTSPRTAGRRFDTTNQDSFGAPDVARLPASAPRQTRPRCPAAGRLRAPHMMRVRHGAFAEPVGGPRRPLLFSRRPCERTRRWYP